ncbi:MAG: hypothetical protein COA33_000795 [Fluviicola sp.]|nr:hypothetical protein [Fluviicola sp.]
MKITGKVTIENNRPATGLSVRAYSQTVRTEKLLASSVTNAQGNYELDLQIAKRTSVEIKVYNPRDRRPIATSDFVVDDQKTMEVNLSIAKTRFAGLSTYQGIEAKVIEVLGSDSVIRIADKKMRVLAIETGFSPEQVESYKKAEILS